MNEDQPHNDHRLHIEPCPCGNEHPEVSGDDLDAMVDCVQCSRSTPVCRGTRSAINYWNKHRINLIQTMPTPPIEDLTEENEKLREKLRSVHQALTQLHNSASRVRSVVVMHGIGELGQLDASLLNAKVALNVNKP